MGDFHQGWVEKLKYKNYAVDTTCSEWNFLGKLLLPPSPRKMGENIDWEGE